MSEGISIREFARREGCSDMLVRKAISQGRLVKLEDGTLDAATVGTAWRKGNWSDGAPKAAKAKVKVAPAAAPDKDATIAAEVARVFGKEPKLMSLMEATTMKENYLARLRQLEYDQKAGTVVLVEDVAREVGKRYAAVRSKLLAIPTNIAPELARTKAAAQIEDKLREKITWALEELIAENAGEL